MMASDGRIATITRAITPLIALVCAAAILLRFPPEQYHFYPQCPMYALFHIQCPGCGTTRVLAELLHGNLADALRLNALTTLMLPLAAAYAAVCYWRFLKREAFRWPQLPAAGIYAGIAIAVLFMVLRNLPLCAL